LDLKKIGVTYHALDQQPEQTLSPLFPHHPFYLDNISFKAIN